MLIEDIIASMNVIKFFNPNMASLYDVLFRESLKMGEITDQIAQFDQEGRPIYECLVVYQIDMANALHDYTYNIINPFDSIIVKNSVREQICRQVYGLEANF